MKRQSPNKPSKETPALLAAARIALRASSSSASARAMRPGRQNRRAGSPACNDSARRRAAEPARSADAARQSRLDLSICPWDHLVSELSKRENLDRPAWAATWVEVMLSFCERPRGKDGVGIAGQRVVLALLSLEVGSTVFVTAAVLGAKTLL
jgi:hypothetical protein